MTIQRLKMLQPNIARVSGRTVPVQAKEKAAVYYTRQHIEWSAAVLKRADGQCERCGRSNTRLYADHIVELRDETNWSLSNGQGAMRLMPYDQNKSSKGGSLASIKNCYRFYLSNIY